MNSSKYSEAIKIMNRDKPKIRFKEFEEAWSKCNIKGLGNIITGSTPSKSDNNNYGGQYLFVSPTDICKERYVTKTATTLSKKGFEMSRVIKPKSILFVCIGSTIGKIAQLLSIGTTNQQINSIEPYETFNTNYVFSLLEKISEKIKKQSATQAIPIINKTSFEKIHFVCTKDVAEQEKIGKLFERIDHLLNLQQRKCDKLKDIKKSMLTKMFPKPGKKVPEVRFEGFTDDWVECKLGEIAVIKMGQSPSGNTYSTTPSKYILVQGNADLINGWVCPRVWTTQITQQANAGDLIMSVRAPAGQMGKTAYDVVIGRGVAAIKGNEFIFQSLAKMNDNNYWKHLSCGSTFESLNSENIKMAVLSTPSKKEQEKIGKLFERLDHLISQNDLKLSKFRLLKRSLLDGMFV